MRENPGALEKLYAMLNEADSLGLSRPARLRLVGIIGSLENEELDRFRNRHEVNVDMSEGRVDGGQQRANTRH